MNKQLHSSAAGLNDKSLRTKSLQVFQFLARAVVKINIVDLKIQRYRSPCQSSSGMPAAGSPAADKPAAAHELATHGLVAACGLVAAHGLAATTQRPARVHTQV